MTDPSFVHLHVHTEFSALDGLSRVSGVVSAAAADGQPAVAITDHGTLAGAYTLAQEAKAAGIKPIIGIEAYLAIGDRHERNTVEVPPEDDAVDTDAADEVAGKTKTKRYEHVTLLATSKQGWASLVSIHNASQESRWGKHARIDYDLLAEHSEGIIVLTGCLGGPVLGTVARGDVTTARENLQRLVAIVGRENVYVEVMEHDIPIESRALPVVADLADEVGVQLVATNDSHYTCSDDATAHEAWLALQTSKRLTDPSPPRFAFTGSGFHVRTAGEMRDLRDEDWWATACDNTLRLADRVEDDILPDSYLRLPKFPVPEGFKDARAYFVHLVRQGAQRRYGDPLPPEVRDRLNVESKVIRDFGIVDYFLIVHELISWSREQGIHVGPGRGSSAGSVSSFCLGIVDVDPIRFDLLFERFLDPTRVGMPDIDIDFEKGRRDEVLSHLRDVYGQDHVARIGTFQVSKTKQAIKSAGQVLGTHPRVTNELTKLIPMDGTVSATLAELDAGAEKAAKSFWDTVERENAYDVVDLARSFEEVVRGQSIHACGVVVSDAPLHDLIPLRKDTGAGSSDHDPLVTEWDADGVEGIGLLKLDVLGLRNLDIVSQALDSVAHVTGERITVEDIPDGDDVDDPRVRAAWRLLGEGHTQGIFQMECVTGRTLVSGRPIEWLYADQEAGNALEQTFSFYLDESRVGRNRIRRIVWSGRKPVAMLVTESGRFVEATGGHRFMTQDGWRDLDDILVGDRVLVDPSAQTRTVADHVTPEFFIPGWMVWEEVVRITDEGVHETYDIAMQAPAHNYFANGFMVHNSGGMTALSRDVQPSSMEHMTALVALYRPGPLSANMHAHYANRKNGREPVDYSLFTNDPREQEQIASVLGNTFGLTVYQEQMMLLGDVVAGFGPAERNRLRKAVSRKIASEVDAVGELFMAGAVSGTASDGSAKLAFDEGTAARVWETIEGGADYAFNRCVTGDTEVETGGGTTWTVEALHQRLHGSELGPGDTCPRCHERPSRPDSVAMMCGRCASWLTMLHDSSRGLHLLAVDSTDGRIRPQRFVGVHHNGFRQVYELTLADGRTVQATDNHRFMDADMGYVHVGDIVAGHTSLAVSGPYEVHRYEPSTYRLTRGERQGVGIVYGRGRANIGYVDGGSVLLKEWTEETVTTAACGQCGMTHEQGRLERAHLDGDRANNAASNLRWLCVSHHKAHDYQYNNRPRRWQKGRPVEASLVVSVVAKGVEPVFDVEMANGTDHNFVANGVVSHNSHSAAYGQLAYVTAFIKANWPGAYGAAVLANTDGEDKRAGILRSLSEEGIDVRPPELNTSGVVTTATSDGVVVLGMGEVKGVGKAAEVIIAERDANGAFSSVADVFSRTKGLTVTTLAGLIEAGACDVFGPRLAQLRVLRALRAHPDTLVGVEEWGLTERAVRQHERLGLIVGAHPMSGRGLGPQLKGWNPDITDKRSGDLLGAKPQPLHRVMASGEGQVLTVGLVTRWDVKAGRDGGRRAEVTLAGSRTQVEAMVWPRTMRSVQRLDPPVGVGTVAGVLATIRTREVEQVDDEGNDEVVTVRNLSVDRVWPIEFTDVGEVAEVPASLGFDVGAALFDPSAAVPAPVLPSVLAEPEPEPVVEADDFDADWSSDGARPARRDDTSRGAVGVAERTKKRTHRPGPVDKDTVVDPVGGKVLRMRETGRLSVEAPKGVYRHWGLVSPPTEFGHQALLSEPDVYRITAADGGVLTIVVVPMGHDLNTDVDTSTGEWVPFGGCDHWQRLSRG